MSMDVHKQAIKIGKRNSKGKPNNKSNKKCLKTLFTHRHILNIYLNKLPFVLDLTNKKWWIAFQVQLMNWQLLLFKWSYAKFHLKISIKISMQSIIQVVQRNANFLKSCQLLLYLEFAQFRNISQELNAE